MLVHDSPKFRASMLSRHEQQTVKTDTTFDKYKNNLDLEHVKLLDAMICYNFKRSCQKDKR